MSARKCGELAFRRIFRPQWASPGKRVARFEEAVYVLHCFVKKTQATRKADIDLGKQRYATLREARKSK